MKKPTLILKAFGDYEEHVRTKSGVVSTFKKRVVLCRFTLDGVDVHVPYPVFDYPGNVLATPDVEPDGDHLVMRFNSWRLFDIVMNRYLPITLNVTHPGCAEVLTLVDRYIQHARELDDDQLEKWVPKAAAQLGVAA